MKQSSPETKRDDLFGMQKQVREAMEEENQQFFADDTDHIFSTVTEKQGLKIQEECM